MASTPAVGRAMKRAADLIVSGAALVLALPFLALIALAIKLDSAGPVFYRQQRVGRFGRTFAMHKFRSMVRDADRIGSYSTVPGDRRVTRVGAVLRKTSIDELPQLLNVLTGEMSLVGPRPDVPQQRDGYTAEEWELRHSVRPGITGLAQATLRSYATPAQRKQLDLDYVRNANFLFDLKIIAMTLNQLVRKGSY